ncbi:hypothetical protein [Sodalis sp. RH13]|uniref:hypothetical protein n=1 Tax=Sodalis sp. RH13 TaxID=3394328 RepID=UPI0039B3D217
MSRVAHRFKRRGAWRITFVMFLITVGVSTLGKGEETLDFYAILIPRLFSLGYNSGRVRRSRYFANPGYRPAAGDVRGAVRHWPGQATALRLIRRLTGIGAGRTGRMATCPERLPVPG